MSSFIITYRGYQNDKKKLLKPLKVDIELHNPRRIIKEFSTINLIRSVLF